MNKFLSLYILYPLDVTYIMTRLGTKLTPEEEKLRRQLDDARRAKAFEKSKRRVTFTGLPARKSGPAKTKPVREKPPLTRSRAAAEKKKQEAENKKQEAEKKKQEEKKKRERYERNLKNFARTVVDRSHNLTFLTDVVGENVVLFEWDPKSKLKF